MPRNIHWPEPFGTMIEAMACPWLAHGLPMACGTPTVAFTCGSVPEVIEDGVTGYIVESEEEAVRALSRLDKLSRKTCRQVFEARFSVSRMAEDYLAICRSLAGRRRSGTIDLSSETDSLLVPSIRVTEVGDVLAVDNEYNVRATSGLADHRTRVLK